MDNPLIPVIISAIVTILASGGVWGFLTKKMESNSVANKMLLGLGHDRIMFLADIYITRGYVYNDEFENLTEYLYEPYVAMGGNGTAKHMVELVKKLPMRSNVSMHDRRERISDMRSKNVDGYYETQDVTPANPGAPRRRKDD